MPQDDARPATKRRALDLNNVRLSTVWRGYDPADVDRLLQQAAGDYESALRELDRLEAQHAALGAQLSEYRERERELARTLSAAREAADAIRTRAVEKARRISQEAEARAADVVRQALAAQDKIRSQIDELAGSRRTIEEKLERSITSLREGRNSALPAAGAGGANLEVGPAVNVRRTVDDHPPAVAPLAQAPSSDLQAPEEPSEASAPPVALAAPLTQPKPATRRFTRAALLNATAAAVAFFVVAYELRDRRPPAAPAASSTSAVPDTPTISPRVEEPPSSTVPSAPAAPQRAEAPARPRAAAPAGTRRVIIGARRECWLRAIADGLTVREGLVRAGEEIVLEFRDTASVRAGDAGAVSMTLDGQPLGPLGGDGQVVTRRFAGRR